MKDFIKDTAERATKTFAEAMLGFVVVGNTLAQVDWSDALSVSAVATLASILASLASMKLGDTDTASLVKKEEEEGEE